YRSKSIRSRRSADLCQFPALASFRRVVGGGAAPVQAASPGLPALRICLGVPGGDSGRGQKAYARRPLAPGRDAGSAAGHSRRRQSIGLEPLLPAFHFGGPESGDLPSALALGVGTTLFPARG